MYHVIATYPVQGFSPNGWVRKNGSHLGVFVKDYGGELYLYKASDKKSKVQHVLKKYPSTIFSVLNCENNWLYVSIVISHKKYEGWLAPDMQCANAYTTCN